MLFLCGRLGLDGGKYQAVEFSGSTVRGLSMQERMTLCNMTAELGAQTGLVAPDETTRNYLLAAGVPDAGLADLAFWQTDPDAAVLERHSFDGAALAPQVAAPHRPSNVSSIADVQGQPVDVAYVGACTDW
jgi:3-isopropylmalate/(R)-2-methylmalate dehydratase large subunit